MVYTHDLSIVTLLINVPSFPGATGLSLKLGQYGYEEEVWSYTCSVLRIRREAAEDGKVKKLL